MWADRTCCGPSSSGCTGRPRGNRRARRDATSMHASHSARIALHRVILPGATRRRAAMCPGGSRAAARDSAANQRPTARCRSDSGGATMSVERAAPERLDRERERVEAVEEVPARAHRVPRGVELATKRRAVVAAAVTVELVPARPQLAARRHRDDQTLEGWGSAVRICGRKATGRVDVLEDVEKQRAAHGAALGLGQILERDPGPNERARHGPAGPHARARRRGSRTPRHGGPGSRALARSRSREGRTAEPLALERARAPHSARDASSGARPRRGRPCRSGRRVERLVASAAALSLHHPAADILGPKVGLLTLVPVRET